MILNPSGLNIDAGYPEKVDLCPSITIDRYEKLVPMTPERHIQKTKEKYKKHILNGL